MRRMDFPLISAKFCDYRVLMRKFLIMRRQKTIGLYLTGGLGNQLFQFAAAITNSQGRLIEIIEKPGRPRLNSNGDPEIFSLSLDNLANIHRRKEDGFILGKSVAYVLRCSILPDRLERNRLFSMITVLMAAVLHSFYFRRLYFPLTIPDVGYSKITRSKKLERVFNPFLVGYFQSFVWPESVRIRLQSLKLVDEGPRLQSLRLEAQLMAPTIIHIRRGDYEELEKTHGLPGENYYRAAMDIVDKSYASHPIWVFSDDVNQARKILAWLPKERVKYISDVDGQSASSLMAMRLGCAYIIANSTFSWWGAFLSECEDPLVVAPNPWFTGRKEPSLLIPSKWIRITY